MAATQLKDIPPRAANKPLPRTVTGWLREIQGIKAFLERMDTYKGTQGLAWVEKQTQYSRERLDWLLQNDPRRKRIRRRATLEHPMAE